MLSKIPKELKEFLQNPFKVSSKDGNRLIVKNEGDAMDVSTIIAYASQFNGTLVHIGGGCKGIEEKDEDSILLYFLNLFQGCNKGLCSGGTTDVSKSGGRKIMITEIPPALAQHQGNATFATFPRVGAFRFIKEGNLVTSKWDTAVNTSYGINIAVQSDPFSDFVDSEGEDRWDGDLQNRFIIYQALQDSGTEIVSFGFNGGLVTIEEMKLCIQAGFPVFLVEGLPREDWTAFITKMKSFMNDSEKFENAFGVSLADAKVHFLPFHDVEASRKIVEKHSNIYS